MKMLRKIYDIIESDDNKYNRYFDNFIVVLIILNVFSVIAESFVTIYSNYYNIFQMFELGSVVIFSIEYLLRLITSRYKYPDVSPGKAVIAYILSFMAIIDLLAILPFYLPLILSVDLRFLRIIRLIRIFRILKLSRYMNSIQLLGKVLKNKKEDLVVTIFVLMIFLTAASSLMYYLENPVQPDEFPNIIAAFWWGIATLTTVGYGDIYPVTVAGKIVSGIIAVLGIGLVALPTGIISSGFLEEIQNSKKIESAIESDVYLYCPHCGKNLKINK